MSSSFLSPLSVLSRPREEKMKMKEADEDPGLSETRSAPFEEGALIKSHRAHMRSDTDMGVQVRASSKMDGHPQKKLGAPSLLHLPWPFPGSEEMK